MGHLYMTVNVSLHYTVLNRNATVSLTFQPFPRNHLRASRENVMATYSEVLKVLAAVYGADEKATRGPLRARLQNLQKFGIPLGMNVGKGKKIDYRDGELYQLAFSLELADVGIMPNQIQTIIRGLWLYRIYGYFREALDLGAKDDIILIFDLNQMSSAWVRDDLEAKDFHFAEIRGNNETLGAGIKDFIREGWRHLSLINVSALVRAVEKERARISFEA
jgi:hypothetical protein